MATPKDNVENIIANNTVAIFSRTWCGYCRAAKKLFAQNFPDVSIQIIELDERNDGDAIQEYLLEKTGQTSVPNIFVNEKHVGGNSDAQAAFKAGTLKTLVSGA